jgi:hypothetical protein
MKSQFLHIFAVVTLGFINCVVLNLFSALDGNIVFVLISIISLIILYCLESTREKENSVCNNITSVLADTVIISCIVISVSMTIQNDLYNSFSYLYSGMEIIAPILMIILNTRYIKKINKQIILRIIKLSIIIIGIKLVEILILYIFICLNFDGNDFVNLFISLFSILFCYFIYLYITKHDVNNEDNNILIKNITLSFTIFFITFPYLFYSYLLMVLMFTK